MKNLDRLLEILLAEKGDRPPLSLPKNDKESMFRLLCNIRGPIPASAEFLSLQDEYLQEKVRARGIVNVETLNFNQQIALWQGDIARLNSDAIVNAGNADLLGCFSPLHNCIDNVIHSYGGVQIRLDCQEIMQGRQTPNGCVAVTKAYNLPSRFVFHTVGPMIQTRVTVQDRNDLASCYQVCLDKAAEMQLQSIAFCCLSTGVFRYPQDEACHVAVTTVRNWLKTNDSRVKVIFNTFLDEDRVLYERELRK